MAGLRLQLDPSQMTAGAEKARSALDKVVDAAKKTEIGLKKVGDSGSGLGTALKGGASEAGRAADQVSRLGAQTANASGKMSGGAQSARMMAMQLSQVAQQSMATGNFVQALAIQLPDMALGFGAVGIAAGIVAGVALPLISNALFGTSENAMTTTEALKELASATDAYQASAEASLQSLDDLKERYGSMAEEARKALEAMASADQFAAVAGINATVATIEESLLRVAGLRERITALTNGEKSNFRLADDFGLAKSAADSLLLALDALSSATGVEDQANAALRVVNAIDSARDSAGQLPAPLQEAYASMAQLAEQASATVGTTEQITGETFNLRDAAVSAAVAMGDIGGAAQGAFGAVAALASKLWEAGQARAAATNQLSQMAVEFSPGGQALAAYGGRGAPSSAQAAIGKRNAPVAAPARSGGGGGARAATETASAYDTLMASLDPAVRASQEMAKSQAVVNAALKGGKISAEQAARSMDLVREKYGSATDTIESGSSVWKDFEQSGRSALDRLIDGTTSLKDALRGMLKEMAAASLKRGLLGGNGKGGLLGGLFGGLFGGGKGLFAGLFDSGGTIGSGQTGIVGENGPEFVTSKSSGAVVTSRAETSRILQGGGAQRVEVHVTTSIDNEGGIKNFVTQSSMQAAAAAVGQVKSSLPGWNRQFSRDGAIA